MSDIQCAARILVVRHAEARYRDPDLVGGPDLGLTARGVRQAGELAARLAGARVAGIYTSTMRRAAETAQILGAALDRPAQELAGVQEYSVGALAGSRDQGAVDAVFDCWAAGDLAAAFPGGESGADLVARFGAAVEDVADSFRGETVVVVSHGGVMAVALSRLAGPTTPDPLHARWLAHCAVAEVDVDADGWALRSWPGSIDPAAAAEPVDNEPNSP